jgi:integrase
MPKQIKPLTDVQITSTKPAIKPQTLFDGDGLYLEISPAGGKLWRLKYRCGGKGRLMALGKYPDVSLKDARGRREAARKMLANGIDPGEAKKAQKAAVTARAANSFEAIAREWFGRWKHTKAASHSDKVIRRLERDVFPWMGEKPVDQITAPIVLSVLRRIEGRGVFETAHRAKESISQIMRYAIATGRAERDPCPDLKGSLTKVKHTHMAAILDPVKVGALMRAIDAFKGTYEVKAALCLAPLVFVRPGELRAMRWENIDLNKAEWKYVASKTKSDHLVPLAPQAVKILEELHPLTGRGEWCFPGRDPKQPISNSTLNAALVRMGYDTKGEMTAHGFRAMARTLLAEELHFPPEVIEHQLAHRVSDALGTAYNRTLFLKERKAMMHAWADYLDKLKVGAEVVQFRA